MREKCQGDAKATGNSETMSRRQEAGGGRRVVVNPASCLLPPASRFRRRTFAEIGQSMVEMAFILPIFLAMVLAIFEFGRAWMVKQSLTNAARAGARILVLPYGGGLTYSSEGDLQTAARDAVTSYLNSSGVPVGTGTQINFMRVQPGGDFVYGTPDDVIEQNYTDGKRGDRVGIQIRHNFDTALPFLLGMFRDPQAPPPEGNEQPQTGITMGITCYMDHE